MTHLVDTRDLTRCCQTDDALHLPESPASQIGGSRSAKPGPTGAAGASSPALATEERDTNRVAGLR